MVGGVKGGIDCPSQLIVEVHSAPEDGGEPSRLAAHRAN